MDRVEIGDGRGFLMATPDKAIADKIYVDRGNGIQTQKELRSYLEEDLRIDPSDLRELRPEVLDAIAQRYRSRRVRLLSALVRRMQRSRGEVDSHV
jgi:hypothetical protein